MRIQLARSIVLYLHLGVEAIAAPYRGRCSIDGGSNKVVGQWPRRGEPRSGPLRVTSWINNPVEAPWVHEGTFDAVGGRVPGGSASQWMGPEGRAWPGRRVCPRSHTKGAARLHEGGGDSWIWWRESRWAWWVPLAPRRVLEPELDPSFFGYRVCGGRRIQRTGNGGCNA